MKAFDLIVTYNNERYLIEDAESEEKRGIRMYQRLNLTRVDKYDVTYQVPVPSIYGDFYADFPANIQICGPHTDFVATISIYNYYWYPADGLNDGTTPPAGTSYDNSVNPSAN